MYNELLQVFLICDCYYLSSDYINNLDTAYSGRSVHLEGLEVKVIWNIAPTDESFPIFPPNLLQNVKMLLEQNSQRNLNLIHYCYINF